jgi:pyruvate dehydrogenase E2 component (dihydrolipoamide acetyltransferase)
MAQVLEMPKLSDTMTEGVLRKWHRKEGDQVAPGDVIAEVETDKATMDYEAYDQGVLLKLLIKDGDTVPVGTPIAILGQAGEDVSAVLAQAQGRKGGGTAAPAPPPAAEGTKPEAAAPPDGAKAAPARTPPKAASPAPAPSPAAPAPSPAAPAPAARPASGPGTPTPPAGEKAVTKARPAPAAPAAPDGKVLASPLARKLATELGVDLRNLAGSGPGGRIVERDVKAAAEAPAPAPPPAAPPAPAAEAPAARADSGLKHPLVPDRRQESRAPSWEVPGEDQRIPLSLMRKTIARRLVESKNQAPHFYLTAEADMEGAMAFREQVKEVHGAKLSINDLVIKAAALALRRVPECNASWTDEAIIRHARVDIGMAVAVEDGLLTPVIRSADVKTLGQIASEAQDLAGRARERKLRPEDMTGSTFSISNLGMMGIKQFTAVINPPEGAILAVGAVRKEAVVKNDQIVVGQRMALTLSCDHRVIDGALGARLLGTIVSILERPITLAF